MRKIVIGKATGLFFVSALLLSFQGICAYNATDLHEKAEKFKGMVRSANLSWLKQEAEKIEDDVIRKPLVWYTELLEMQPETATNAREFIKARQQYRRENRATIPSSGTLDGIAHQWADTVGQILVKLYSSHYADDVEDRKRAAVALGSLQPSYDALLENLKAGRVLHRGR